MPLFDHENGHRDCDAMAAKRFSDRALNIASNRGPITFDGTGDGDRPHGQRGAGGLVTALAHKGRTVAYLLDQLAWPGALPVYLGDDDKDEDAFETIKAYQGVALVVGAFQRKTLADARLASPQAARVWLNTLVEQLCDKPPG